MCAAQRQVRLALSADFQRLHSSATTAAITTAPFVSSNCTMISSSAAPMSFTTSSSHVSTQDHAHAAEGAALAPEWSDLQGAETHVDAASWAGGGWERREGQHDRRPANASKEKATGRGSARGTDTPSRPTQGYPKVPPDSRRQPYRPGPPTSRGEPPGPHGVPGAPRGSRGPTHPRLQRPRTRQPLRALGAPRAPRPPGLPWPRPHQHPGPHTLTGPDRHHDGAPP